MNKLHNFSEKWLRISYYFENPDKAPDPEDLYYAESEEGESMEEFNARRTDKSHWKEFCHAKKIDSCLQNLLELTIRKK